MKEIWLIYSSNKGGHKYPAEALATYLKKHCPQFRVSVINLFTLSSFLAFFDVIGQFGDLKLRSLWRATAKQFLNPSSPFTRLYRESLKLGIGLSGVKDFLRHKPIPQLIISFQPELNACAQFFKRWFRVKFYSVVIDLLINDLWVQKGIDRYYVPNAYAQKELIRWGVSKEKIVISGLPLREGFRGLKEEMVPEIKKKWHLPKDIPCILVMGGLLGKMVNFRAVIDSIRNGLAKRCDRQERDEFHKANNSLCLILIYGKDRKEREVCESLARDSSLALYSFGLVEDIHELMMASDIIITKPSSGTISEACALGKPLLLLYPTGGAYQDIRFASLLHSLGAGEVITKTEELGKRVKEIINNQEKINKLKTNSRAFGERNLFANEIIASSLIADYQAKRF